MMKLKLRGASSASAGSEECPTASRSAEELLQEQVEALRVALDDKTYQLEQLRQETVRQMETLRDEEQRRLAFALGSLRRRLHREKVAEMKKQKEQIVQAMQQRIGDQSTQGPVRPFDDAVIPFMDEEEEQGKRVPNRASGDENEQEMPSPFGDDATKDEILSTKDEEEDVGSLGSRPKLKEFDKWLSLQAEELNRLNIQPMKPLHPKMFYSNTNTISRQIKDKFRNSSPSDLNASLSIMAPIQEEKEEYDWFEERRLLLQDKLTMIGKIQALEAAKTRLEAELQETKDQNELLEFRILELEECPMGSPVRSQTKSTDKSTNTDSWWNLETNANNYFLVQRKRSSSQLLPEFNEEKLNEVRRKLQLLVEDQKNPLPENADVFPQTLAFLDVLKQMHILYVKDGLIVKSDDKIKDKLQLPDMADKNGTEKQHSGLSLSSSLDSASEVSDVVSQGGETGYSSDDSIDTEEIYQMNMNSGDFSSPYTSFDGSAFFPTKLAVIGDLKLPIEQLSEQDEVGLEDRRFIVNKLNDCFHWKPLELLQRIKEQEAEERKAKESLQTLQDKVDKLQRERDALHEKCLELEEAENDSRLNEQNGRRKLVLIAETEKSLRQHVADLTEKDQAAKKRIANLEQERDKLRLEAVQLLNLINNCKILPKIADTPQDAIHSEQDIAGNARKCTNTRSTESENCSRVLCPKRPLADLVPCAVANENLSKSTNALSVDDEQLNLENAESTPVFSVTKTLRSLCEQCLKACPNHSSSPDKACIRLLLEENVALHHFNCDKIKEIKNKEAEYKIKLEALKCDHDETLSCMEEKLAAAQQHERELREQLETAVRLKETIEAKYAKTCDEMHLEKTFYLQQIQTLQSDKGYLEKKIDSLKDSDYSSLIEDIYENGNGETFSAKERSKQTGHTKKIRELENHLSLLCQVAEDSIKNTNADGIAVEEFLGTEDDNLLEKIHDLMRTETRLKQKIFELEKKEMAYKETLHEADKIMADVEKSYKDRIEELEMLEEKLRGRIVQLEQSEKRLRQALRNTNRNSEVAKFGELLDRLLETEASEQRLKDRIYDLEQKEREQKQYILSLEKEKHSLEAELQEHEELMQTINNMKRTEKELRLQIEGLETSESALQETLFQADSILAERENKLQDKLEGLEAEMENLQRVNYQLNSSEAELKTMLEDAYSNLEQLQRNLQRKDDSCFELVSVGPQTGDAVSASDVQQFYIQSHVLACTENHPVRLQQMSDIIENNAQLECQIIELKSTIEQLRKQVLHLESQLLRVSSKPTTDCQEIQEHQYLALNLQLLARNSQIERLQDKIKLLEVGNTAAELQNCNCCNCINCRPLLQDIESQVFLLDEIISGSCSTDSQATSQEGNKTSASTMMNQTHQIKIEGVTGKKYSVLTDNARNHKDQAHRSASRNSLNEDHQTSATKLQNLQNQMAQLETDLMQKIKLLETKAQEMEKLENKFEAQTLQKEAKELEFSNLQNSFKSLQRENADLLEKKRKTEISEQLLRENLARKKQDLIIVNKQVQQLEQRLSYTNKQLKSIDQMNEENGNLRQKLQELEVEVQKKRESERKLHADNLHLHHKVEAQRERINSLQVIKKDYKLLMAKYEVLEKQKKIVDQAIVPLKNKIAQLTQKCKEKDQLISHLTKQNKRTCNSAKSKEKSREGENITNENLQLFDEITGLLPSPEMNSSLSSSNGASDSSFDLSSDVGSPKSTPNSRSRIPRYTALTSPLNSPRSKQIDVIKNARNEEKSPETTPRTDYTRFLNSPRVKSAVEKISTVARKVSSSKIPSPPSNFRVTRHVGHDSLLVAWLPPSANDGNAQFDGINSPAGYQVFVNNQLHQKVRSPDRTKALLNGLDLGRPMEIAIRTVAETGLLSAPATLTFDATMSSGNESARSSDVATENLQTPLKRECIVTTSYIPKHKNTSNPFFELKLEAGDVVTVFGVKQANGFFYGEAKGERGLVPAHVLQDLPTSQQNEGGVAKPY